MTNLDQFPYEANEIQGELGCPPTPLLMFAQLCNKLNGNLLTLLFYGCHDLYIYVL